MAAATDDIIIPHRLRGGAFAVKRTGNGSYIMEFGRGRAGVAGRSLVEICQWNVVPQFLQIACTFGIKEKFVARDLAKKERLIWRRILKLKGNESITKMTFICHFDGSVYYYSITVLHLWLLLQLLHCRCPLMCQRRMRRAMRRNPRNTPQYLISYNARTNKI